MIDTIRWRSDSKDNYPGTIRLIDQTLLPETLTYIETTCIVEMYHCIKRLSVRGAPAIGIAGAMGLAVSMQTFDGSVKDFLSTAQKNADYLNSSRPTAVNLAWGLGRCVKTIQELKDVDTMKRRLISEAVVILEEDIQMCKNIGKFGAEIIKEGASIMTHCNAGALATGDYGTALSPIYHSYESGKSIKVFSNETRPLLQGSRLTAWELNKAGVDVTTVCDNMAGAMMQKGMIDIVITGADRVAANGDAANKIGTYSVAVLAKYHNIPFYIAVPYSTVDMALSDGEKIPIEERDASEIYNGFGKQTAPKEVNFYSPAFDVTPAELITGIITDKGILYPPFKESLKQLFID